MPISVTTYSPYGSSEGHHYRFEPQEDITAYELARAVPLLAASWERSYWNEILDSGPLKSYLNGSVEALPDDVRRHFAKHSGTRY